MEMRKHGIRLSRISGIFISHLHGDHFFGLPGLLATFQLLGRRQELHVYGPAGIRNAITLLFRLGDSWMGYPLIFHELEADTPCVIYEDSLLKVQTLPLRHRIYTNGFLFSEKPGPRKLDIEAARAYGIDRAYFRKITNGSDIQLPDGRVIKNEEVSLPPPKPRSYAYCSDTAYHPALVAWIRGVDLLYHEATFLESEANLSEKTGHSTALQAARIAREAGVGKLILGHYSTRYRDIRPFREEAASLFPKVELAEEGKTFDW